MRLSEPRAQAQTGMAPYVTRVGDGGNAHRVPTPVPTWSRCPDHRPSTSADSLEALERNEHVKPTDTLYLVPERGSYFY